ncbi:MAG: YebC/PmpR family DNA-binding transcriptional regulator [bacterium]|nr:YebC/PmpR family DNA-binding transcriptional regulator [bacterium]
MSGHSHAKTIKHQKNLTDQKRGQMFSKMAKVISVAVKAGGANPETNNKLKVVMEQAKEFNMPKDNIERAIKQAEGGQEADNLNEMVFEAYGPGGVAIIIEAITENKNRALGEVKQALNQYGGKLVGEGAIRWMFDRKGVIVISPTNQTPNPKSKEELELAAIEAGAQDMHWEGDDTLSIYTKTEEMEKTRKALEAKGIKTESASLDWVPKEEITADEKTKESCEKLFNALDETDSVQETYSNIKQ